MAQFKTATQQLKEAPREQKIFEAKFRARVEDSKEYRQYRETNLYHGWEKDITDRLEIVPMVAIHMPVERFDILLQDQRRLEDYKGDAEYGKKIVNMLRADERVRDENPTVAKAYRNYLMLLELARK